MCSAWPLVVVWKGTDHMFQILYLVVDTWNSTEVKVVLLSVMKVSGRLCVVNSFLWTCRVPCEDTVDTGTTSSHFM